MVVQLPPPIKKKLLTKITFSKISDLHSSLFHCILRLHLSFTEFKANLIQLEHWNCAIEMWKNSKVAIMGQNLPWKKTLKFFPEMVSNWDRRSHWLMSYCNMFEERTRDSEKMNEAGLLLACGKRTCRVSR